MAIYELGFDNEGIGREILTSTCALCCVAGSNCELLVELCSIMDRTDILQCDLEQPSFGL